MGYRIPVRLAENRETPMLSNSSKVKRREGNSWQLVRRLLGAKRVVGGKKVIKSLGLVTTEQVVGFKISGELDLNKFNGGMALALADKLVKGREWVIRTLTDDALAMGANGLVDIDIRYESLGAKEEVLMVLVYAKGTAVMVK
jgi:uncharacterized protein YbjQ (UPF0145 family)